MKDKKYYLEAIRVAIYIFIDKISFENAVGFFEDLVYHNSIAIPEVLKEDKDMLIKINEEFSKGSSLFTNEDKKLIINSLIKEIYLWSSCNEKAWDNELSYIERQSNYTNYLRHEAKIKVVINKVLNDEKLEQSYQEFRQNLIRTVSIYKNICKVADKINKEGYKSVPTDSLRGIISERMNQTKKLFSKYFKIFGFSEDDFESILEKDLKQKNLSNKNNLGAIQLVS